MLAFLPPVTYRWGHRTFHGPLIAALAASAAWVLESGEKGEAERRLIVKVMPGKMIDASLGFPVSLSGGRNV